MINDLVSKLKDRHYADLLAKGRLVCPDCGAAATDAPDAGASTMRCARCRTTVLLEEWSRAGRDGLMVGDADSPPPDTKIVRSTNGGGTTWHIPAGGKGGCFLLFAGIWLSGIAVVSMPMIFGFITDPTKQQGDIPGWAIIPFLGLFWIIGLGVLYLGLRAQFAQYLLTVDGSMIALRREMFGRVSEKSIALDEVVRIVQKEFYQKNYQSVFGIEIEGKRSKLRFGSMLEDDEKAWLVADLRRAFMQPGDILPPMASYAPLTATPPAGRQSSFSFTLETPWLAILIPALIVLPVGIFFVCIGFWVINPGNPQDRGPDWVRLFGAAWLLMSSVVTISAASGALFVLRNRGARSQFDGDETNVSIRLMKGERSIREKWYPRSEVTTVKAVTRGKYGTTEMKRVLLLVGGKKIEIAKWVPAIEADQFVRAANAALHGK